MPSMVTNTCNEWKKFSDFLNRFYSFEYKLFIVMTQRRGDKYWAIGKHVVMYCDIMQI